MCNLDYWLRNDFYHAITHSQGSGRCVGEESRSKYKILILDGSLDHETSASTTEDTVMGAVEFIEAILGAGDDSRGRCRQPEKKSSAEHYVTHVIHLEGEGTPNVGRARLAGMGIECVELHGRAVEDGKMRYDRKAWGRRSRSFWGVGVSDLISVRGIREH